LIKNLQKWLQNAAFLHIYDLQLIFLLTADPSFEIVAMWLPTHHIA